MNMKQNRNQRDRQTPKNPEPNINIAPRVITKRLSGCPEKFINDYRNVFSHTRLKMMIEIAEIYIKIEPRLKVEVPFAENIS